jgi:hypothetical protein
MPRIALLIFFALVLTGEARAMAPAQATLSPAAPSIAFKGAITGTSVMPDVLYAFGGGMHGNCDAPTCESLALSVTGGGAGTLVVKAKLPDDQANNLTMELELPDGTTVLATSTDPLGTDLATSRKIEVPHPADGAYVVRVGGEVNRDNTGNDVELTGSAGLTGLTAPAAPPVPPAAAPGPQPASSAPPAPATKLTLAAARVTTRSRRIAVRVTTDGVVTGLRARLYRGRGKRAPLAATGASRRIASHGTIALKPRGRLRRGPHILEVTGVDAHGRAVRATAVIVVRRRAR